MIPQWMASYFVERQVLFLTSAAVLVALLYLWKLSPQPPSLTGTYSTLREGEFADPGNKPQFASFLRTSDSVTRLTGLGCGGVDLEFTSPTSGRVRDCAKLPYQSFRVENRGARVVLVGKSEELVLTRNSEVPRFHQ